MIHPLSGMAGKGRKLLLVIGMHRSGTSALARLLNLLGAGISDKLMPAKDDNPRGFWESVALTRLNEQILVEAGRSWDDPRPLSPAAADAIVAPDNVSRVTAQLSAEAGQSPMFVVKDPRISRLVPLWLRAATQAGFEPAFFLCCRNPMEVSGSLLARNGIGRGVAHLLWLTYMLEAEAGTRHAPRAVIHYDALIEDWRACLATALPAAGFSLGDVADTQKTQADAFLSGALRHHAFATDRLLADPDILPAAKTAYAAFRAARAALPQHAIESLNQAGQRYRQAWEFFAAAWDELRARPGRSEPAPPAPGRHEATAIRPPNPPATIQAGGDTDKAAGGSAPPPETAQSPRTAPKLARPPRRVVLHYHLFKNAGTSVDRALKQAFGPRWQEHEGPARGWRPEDIAAYLTEHPEIVALSSHTAVLPLPEIPGVEIFPIIFLRHPIDRVRSVYEFERKQGAATLGAEMAKKMEIREYVEWRLGRPSDGTIRNFQTRRLASGYLTSQKSTRTNVERACQLVEHLPCFGLVERFGESIALFEAKLQGWFSGVHLANIKANTTQRSETTIDDRLSQLGQQLGDRLFRELEQVNSDDLSLYRFATRLFEEVV